MALPIGRSRVSAGTFLVTFFVCAGALALWVDARLGERAPQSLGKVILHGGCSLIALKIASTVAPNLIGGSAKAVAMLALFGVLLPGLMYVFLASIWFLKLVRSALPR
jgi:hypothetical protein